MADILIIDDDPQIRDVLRIALKQAGFATREAGDGAEGLAKALNGRDDLIILDIGLPAMDGFDLCRRLRAEKDTPVLFLTARDDEIDRIVGLELGRRRLRDETLLATRTGRPRPRHSQAQPGRGRGQRHSAPRGARA